MFISYSLFYTFLPILAVGMFEQPVRAETALAYPKAYIVSQQVTPTLSPPPVLANSCYLCILYSFSDDLW